MAQIQIKDASGAITTAAKVTNTGQAARVDSLPVTLQTEDIQVLVPGQKTGIVNTSNTTSVTGAFKTLYAITVVQFSSLTETGATGSLIGITIPAGCSLSGNFTEYTLSSGTLRAYP